MGFPQCLTELRESHLLVFEYYYKDRDEEMHTIRSKRRVAELPFPLAAFYPVGTAYDELSGRSPNLVFLAFYVDFIV